MEQDERAKLSAQIRNRNDVVITRDSIENLVKNFPNYRVSEKQLILLRYLDGLTNHPGDRVSVDLDIDYPAIWARNRDELLFHLEELNRRESIEIYDRHRLGKEIAITTNGWAFLDDHPALADVGNQAFVAMSFSKQMKPAFEQGIQPALKRAGYRAYRVDLDQHNDRIDAKIEHEIRNSAFVVADVTEQKQGVYYEAGFAMALGLPVIWSVKKGELEDVHFDTRQYNHIVWTDEAQLEEDLYNRVSAVIGGPEKKG